MSCASVIPSKRSTRMIVASPFASWTSCASHWNASRHSSRSGSTESPFFRLSVPNCCRRRQNPTRVLDLRWDVKEYEKTNQLIFLGLYSVAQGCNKCYRSFESRAHEKEDTYDRLYDNRSTPRVDRCCHTTWVGHREGVRTRGQRAARYRDHCARDWEIR